MPDLVAQGRESQFRWRCTLRPGQRVTIGRSSGAWSVPWDDHVSRRHFEVCWDNGELLVERLPNVPNPVFFRGDQRDSFRIQAGQHFVVGGTTFTLVDERVMATVEAPRPDNEQTFSAEFLHSVRFRHADQRIDVLSRLPQLISGASSDNELLPALVNLLLAGVPRATAVAFVVHHPVNETSELRILHWDRRQNATDAFTPSTRLISSAVESGESIVHVWGNTQPGVAFTENENFDWACCIPVIGEACRGWAIYVAGSFMSSTARRSPGRACYAARDEPA